jgi:dihydropteroate synthase
VPVIKALRERSDVPVSIDTSKPEVMQAAVEAGASMINDVNALQAPDAVRVAARLSADVCLMHRQGNAATMQDNPVYEDVVSDVLHELQARVADCIDGGIERERLLLDPGFGFGKTTTHNLQLLRGLGQFVATSLPVLVGLSRKSLLQAITERPVEQRLAGSLALATMAAMQGARVIRVHDVAATVDAMKVVAAVTNKHEKQAD